MDGNSAQTCLRHQCPPSGGQADFGGMAFGKVHRDAPRIPAEENGLPFLPATLQPCAIIRLVIAQELFCFVRERQVTESRIIPWIIDLPGGGFGYTPFV